jgi:DNA-directed RNA polymerase omega subunit
VGFFLTLILINAILHKQTYIGDSMKLDTQSRDIDVQKCVENVGGNQFELILIAATRAREIANTRSIAQKNNPQLKYPTRIVTAALEEVEQGAVGREYLGKVRSAR